MFRLSWRLSLITLMGLPIIMAVSNVYGAYYKVHLLSLTKNIFLILQEFFVYIQTLKDKDKLSDLP